MGDLLASSFDRLRSAIIAIIRHEVRHTDYFAQYPARVLSQSSDLRTVDVVPDSDRVPAQRQVKLRTGIPGVDVKLATGSRVIVAWENGDPQRIFAALAEADPKPLEIIVRAATKVTISSPDVRLADGDRPVACVGDIVEVITPATAVLPVGIVLTSPSGTVTGTIAIQPIVAVGQIMRGQTAVKAP